MSAPLLSRGPIYPVDRNPDRSLIPTDLPESDGVPLESAWHRHQMEFLIDQIECRWRGRTDFYCGGNMFIHYSLQQVRNRDFLGPDFFVVLDTERLRDRRYWAPWDEAGRMPDLIIELLSPTTADEDRIRKREIYDRSFGTREYFLYDPDSQTLEGYRRDTGQYEPIEPDDQGRLWVETIGCWLAIWEGGRRDNMGTWIRFFEPDGTLVPTEGEYERGLRIQTQRNLTEAERAATTARATAAAAQARADAEAQARAAAQARADAEAQARLEAQSRADAEQARADAQQARADAEAAARMDLLAEMARLKAELDRLREPHP